MNTAGIYSNKNDIIQDLVTESDSGVVSAVYNGLHFNSVFQPIYDRSQRVYAFEGLVRIHDEHANIIDPSLFFSKVESDVTNNIVHTLLCGKIHLANFLQSNFSHLKLFINASPSVFKSLANTPEAVEYFVQRNYELGSKPSQVVFEITEFVESDLNAIVKGKECLTQYGIQTALDDFGTSHSTPKRAMKIKAPYLKLDKSIVNDKSQVIAAVKLAKKINAITIAEGIEDFSIAKMCMNSGVDLFQGYYFCRPLSILELENQLR
ncbi:EAL domain-containing protein [Vibrio cionasavignyae]|uniref:EAL domain-containing protein n=1 Tax=Vibrio cionasavignyae TaxID=2910252 RepID=UPI003D121067